MLPLPLESKGEKVFKKDIVRAIKINLFASMPRVNQMQMCFTVVFLRANVQKNAGLGLAD